MPGLFETQHHESLSEDHSVLPFNSYLQMICRVPSPFLEAGYATGHTAQLLFQGIEWEAGASQVGK